MSGFFICVCFCLWFGLASSANDQYISCECEPCKKTTCETSSANSCYRIFVSVMNSSINQNDAISAGCINSNFDATVSSQLTLVTIEPDRAYAAVFQCGKSDCNSKATRPWLTKGAGIWEGSRCQFPQEFQNASKSGVVIRWDTNGTLMSDILGWCPKCDVSAGEPRSTETLCQWAKRVYNGTSEKEPSRGPPNKKYLYVSAGITGVIFGLSVVLTVVEFVRTRKQKSTKRRIPRKRNVEPESKSELASVTKEKETAPAKTEQGKIEPGLKSEAKEKAVGSDSKEKPGTAGSKGKATETESKATTSSVAKEKTTESKGKTAKATAKEKTLKSVV